MKKRKHTDRKGFSLIELMVTMSLVGLMAGLATVALSPGNTSLRSSLRNFRFDIELAKHEAIARNADTYVDFYLYPTIDCNGDDDVNQKDRCYVIYEDRNGNGTYDELDPPGKPEWIKSGMLDGSVSFSQYEQLPFSPLGESSPATFRLEAAVKKNCDPVTSDMECLVTSYDINVSEVGRVHIEDKQQTCEAASYCSS